jgi:hypothetical protein
MIVVINADEVAQLQVACHAGCFACDTLHSTPISKEAEGVIIDQLKTRLIEQGSRMRLSDGQTNSIGETLAQGSCRNFDAGSVMGFGMTWGDAVDMLRNKSGEPEALSCS